MLVLVMGLDQAVVLLCETIVAPEPHFYHCLGGSFAHHVEFVHLVLQSVSYLLVIFVNLVAVNVSVLQFFHL